MATIDLDKIPTKDTITFRDSLNIELVQGKFDLSYKSEISKMSDFFMPNNEIDNYRTELEKHVSDLEKWVFGNGTTHLGFATKEILDNNYLYLTESNFYYKRLLTDEVMEKLCSEYANYNMLSAKLEYCKTKGQYVATELANELARIAAIMKTQTIMNDTNVQATLANVGAEIKAGGIIGEGAAALYAALLEARAALEAALAAAAAGAGGGDSNVTQLKVSYIDGKGWVVSRKKPGWTEFAPWWGRATKEAAIASAKEQIAKHPGAYVLV